MSEPSSSARRQYLPRVASKKLPIPSGRGRTFTWHGIGTPLGRPSLQANHQSAKQTSCVQSQVVRSTGKSCARRWVTSSRHSTPSVLIIDEKKTRSEGRQRSIHMGFCALGQQSLTTPHIRNWLHHRERENTNTCTLTSFPICHQIANTRRCMSARHMDGQSAVAVTRVTPLDVLTLLAYQTSVYFGGASMLKIKISRVWNEDWVQTDARDRGMRGIKEQD